MSVSANPDPSAFVLEPSIELKKRIGARKKVQKNQTKSDTFQKPLESLSGNFVILAKLSTKKTLILIYFQLKIYLMLLNPKFPDVLAL